MTSQPWHGLGETGITRSFDEETRGPGCGVAGPVMSWIVMQALYFPKDIYKEAMACLACVIKSNRQSHFAQQTSTTKHPVKSPLLHLQKTMAFTSKPDDSSEGHQHLEKSRSVDDPEKTTLPTDDLTADPAWRATEKRLVRKLDMTMLPVVWLLYMFNYLDRNNIAYVGLLAPSCCFS
jgi:hypothetical protein